jgi:hypothetical protein
MVFTISFKSLGQLIFLYLTLISSIANATTRSSVVSGTFGTAATWSGTVVPTCGDVIIIEAAHTVTISNQYWNTGGCASVPTTIIIRGTLHFTGGGRLILAPGSNVIVEAGGSVTAQNYTGNNNLINLGGTEIWNAGDPVTGGPVSGPWENGNSTLPVKLINFEVQQVSLVNLVSWSTASEINNDYFKVERSRDGENWSFIGEIRGTGNSSIRQNYSLHDNEPLNGRQWYRLIQVDFDGNYEIFNPVMTEFVGVERISVYPNPAKDLVTVMLHEFMAENLYLSDVCGTVMLTEKVAGREQFQFAVSSLIPGFYMLTVSGNGFIQTTRLIIE